MGSGFGLLLGSSPRERIIQKTNVRGRDLEGGLPWGGTLLHTVLLPRRCIFANSCEAERISLIPLSSPELAAALLLSSVQTETLTKRRATLASCIQRPHSSRDYSVHSSGCSVRRRKDALWFRICVLFSCCTPPSTYRGRLCK